MWYVPLTMPAPWLARPLAARLAVSLALAAAVSLALRLPFLSVPLITDEAGYAYVAYWLARGQALYRDLWFDRPQGIFLIYGAILRLVGESTEAIRFAAGLYNAVTTVLLGLLGARLFGPLAGAAGAGVFAVASASPVIEGFTANGEVFMNLPVVLCVLLAVQRRPFLAGIALALATAIKPTALPAAGPALLVALWGPLDGARRPHRPPLRPASRLDSPPPPPLRPGPRRPGPPSASPPSSCTAWPQTPPATGTPWWGSACRPTPPSPSGSPSSASWGRPRPPCSPPCSRSGCWPSSPCGAHAGRLQEGWWPWPSCWGPWPAPPPGATGTGTTTPDWYPPRPSSPAPAWRVSSPRTSSPAA